MESGKTAEAALNNSVILRNIFSHLPLSDLKQCRAVSKNWKSEASSYMQDFRVCNVTIRSFNPCLDVWFCHKLVVNQMVPVNCLTINFGQSIHSACDANGEGASLYDDLIKSMPLKHLYISGKFVPENCPGLLFIIKLLRGTFQNLQSLTLDRVPLVFLEDFAEDWTPWLPKLKELDIGEMHERKGDFVRKILSGAPNLQMLKGLVHTSMLKLFPENKYSLLTNVMLSMTSEEEETNCFKLAKARPALHTLILNAPGSSHRQYRFKYFWVLEQLLLGSSASLEELRMAIVIFPLTKLPLMPNIRKLAIITNALQQQILHVLGSIDVPRALPALETLEIIKSSRNNDNNEDDQFLLNPWGHDEVMGESPSPPFRLKEFLVRTPDLIFLKDIISVFTNGSRFLHVQATSYTPPRAYDDLWCFWPQLECIKLIVSEEAFSYNYDAQFLGINREEAEVLKEMDDESLEQLNLVPIRPSVLTMPRLRALYISFSSVDFDMLHHIPEERFLSRLTGILAFKKFESKGIHVEISCLEEFASHLNHLRDFAQVVLLDDDDGSDTDSDSDLETESGSEVEGDSDSSDFGVEPGSEAMYGLVQQNPYEMDDADPL